jgi:hypothetical protein
MRPGSLFKVLVVSSTLLVGCGSEEAPIPGCAESQPPGDEPRRRCTLPLDVVTPAPNDEGTLDVGLFLVTDPTAGDWTVDEATEIAASGLNEARGILAQCDLELRLEAAQVTTAPPTLLDVEGNDPDAWGGKAPEGTEDPDAFNYALDERLAPEPRALFEHARSQLAPGAIAVVVVDRITFWAAGTSEVAGGLAYPPVVYHHEGDHPERNGVLVAASYSGAGSLPGRINGRTIAHELGHMLLDTAQHLGTDDNLMKAGTSLTEAQCDEIRQSAVAIYGQDPVADPRL